MAEAPPFFLHPKAATDAWIFGNSASLLTIVSRLGESEAGPKRLAAIIRSHWSCETRHWERDVQWREDKCLIRNPNAACALALIRTGLQALLRRTVKQPLPVIFENVADHLELALTWLKQRNFRL